MVERRMWQREEEGRCKLEVERNRNSTDSRQVIVAVGERERDERDVGVEDEVSKKSSRERVDARSGDRLVKCEDKYQSRTRRKKELSQESQPRNVEVE